MADGPQKSPPSAEPRPESKPDVEELDLERWTAAFDRAHGTTEASSGAKDEFLDDPFAVGGAAELLPLAPGEPRVPAPLPPPAPDDSVFSSAPRSSPVRATRTEPDPERRFAQATSTLPSSPTDEEIFAQTDLPEPLSAGVAWSSFGDERTGAGQERGKDAAPSIPSPAPATDLRAPGEAPRSAPVSPARRRPAVVRRDALVARRTEAPGAKRSIRPAEDSGGFEGTESTRIADAGLLERVAGEVDHSAAALAGKTAFAPPVVPADEAFYEGIEIGSSAGPGADEEEEGVTLSSPAPSLLPLRTVSRHVVRREVRAPALAPVDSLPGETLASRNDDAASPLVLADADADADPDVTASLSAPAPRAGTEPQEFAVATDESASEAPEDDDAWSPGVDLSEPLPDTTPLVPVADLHRSSALDLDPSAFALPEYSPETRPVLPLDPIFLAPADLVSLCEGELQRDTQRAFELHLTCGFAAAVQGDVARARDHFEQALAQDPSSQAAARGLRRVLVAEGRDREALATLATETALAQGEERRALALYRVELCAALGETGLAFELARDLANAENDDVRALLLTLLLAYADERDDAAIAVAAQLASSLDDSELVAALHDLRGRLSEKAGRADAAIAAYTEAFAAFPSDKCALLGLARQKSRGGAGCTTTVEAAVALGRFLEGVTDSALIAAVDRRRAAALVSAGRLDLAAQALEEALEEVPFDPWVLENMADLAGRDGRVTDAAHWASEWAKAEPQPARQAQAWRRAATWYASPRGDRAAAQVAWAAVHVADPGDVLAAAELRQQGDGGLPFLRAEVQAQAQRALSQGDFEAAGVICLRAAGRLSREGQTKEAIEILELVREGLPAAFARELAALNMELGRYDVCAALLEGDTTTRGLLCLARACDRHARRSVGDAQGTALASAVAAWETVDQAQPERVAAKLALWGLCCLTGDARACAEALWAVAERAQDPALKVTAALFQLEHADLAAGATDAARQLVDTWPGDPRTIPLAVAAGSRGKELAKIYEARMQALPDGAEKDALRYRAAALLAEDGADASAAELLAQLSRRHPSLACARVLLESVYRRLGDAAGLAECLLADAEEAGRDALEPVGSRAVMGVGDRSRLALSRWVRAGEHFLERAGDPLRATSVLRTVLAARPHEPLYRDGFARAAAAALETAPLCDLALKDRTRAEAADDLYGQISAYEDLAGIDAELRGDVASSTLAWAAIVDLDPRHMAALRALERYYVTEGRTEELLGIYAKLADALSDEPDREAVLLLRSRLHAGALAHSEALADYRLILSGGRPSRLALLHLEARAREVGAWDELVGLEDVIAAYFGSDRRASACFLTRAAELRVETGEHELALERFRQAADLGDGHLPALWAWRRFALAQGRFREVAETAEREAAGLTSDAQRADLFHLAGVALMDGAREGAAAVPSLRQVLALSAGHEDAFLRLRAWYRAAERYQDLAQLFSAKLAVEKDPRRLCAYHEELAFLCRDALSDAPSAKSHLRQALVLEENNLQALAALSDLTWDAGEWSDAADALLRRAKLEKDPATLKACFFRLGLIYSERLPDARWGVKAFEQVLRLDPSDEDALAHLGALTIQLGEYRSALPLTERLVSLVTDPQRRITYLHRLAMVHEKGFGDRKRAEDAHRAALETDPTSQAALSALVDYYQRVNDARSLRIHLDRLAGTMRGRLAKNALDGVAYRVLGRVLAYRMHTGAPLSVYPARAALELAHALECAEDADRQLLSDTLRKVASARGLGDLAIDEHLFHPSIPNGFRQVFRLLHETLGKRFPPELRRYGVSKAQRLPPAGHPVRDVVLGVAAELGVNDLEVYLSPLQATVMAVEVGEPMALILGADLMAGASPPQIRFAAGRALKLAASYLAIAARLSVDELGTLLGGVIRLYEPGFSPAGIHENALLEEQQRLARLIPKRLRDELAPFATEISGLKFDPKSLWWGVQHSGNRAGLLACGSILSALAVISKAAGHKDLEASRGDPHVDELLRFAASDDYGEIRKNLP